MMSFYAFLERLKTDSRATHLWKCGLCNKSVDITDPLDDVMYGQGRKFRQYLDERWPVKPAFDILELDALLPAICEFDNSNLDESIRKGFFEGDMRNVASGDMWGHYARIVMYSLLWDENVKTVYHNTGGMTRPSHFQG